MEDLILKGSPIDNQTEEQKALNYKQREVVATVNPVNWIEKPRETWKLYPGRNQDGSGQCVVMTYSTEQGIIFQQKYGQWIDFSSSYPYQQRSNPTISGCNSTDVYSVFPKIGDVFELFMPSQNMNDAQAMSVKREPYYTELATPFTVKRIVIPIDFETVASTIQETGKGVMVWFHFAYPEWTNIPQILNQVPTLGHSVTAIDFTLLKGKKYLIIQDSWGLQYADKGLRLISEEYFNARCYLASYLLSFKQQDNNTVVKPRFDGSIISAQRCFKFEGMLSTSVIEVESWGPMTRAACKLFQKKYSLLPTLGNFGPLTRAKLSALYP